jgi:hypothetical protein
MKRKEGNDEGKGNKKARGTSPSSYRPWEITARVVASRATSESPATSKSIRTSTEMTSG